MAVVSDGEANGADAGVEVEDIRGGGVGLDFLEGEFVNGEVDLEEAVGRVGIGVAKNGVGEGWEDGVRLMILEEAARDGAVLAATEEERLEAAGLFVGAIEVIDNLEGAGENLGALDGGLADGDFAVGAALVEGEVDLAVFVRVVEGIFHFVAVVVRLMVSDDRWLLDGDAVLAENFLDEGGF